MFWDTHMHCNFSGDSKAAPEDMILAAIHKGLKGICFTDHIDWDYPGPTPFSFNGEQYFVELTDKIVSIENDTAAVSHHKEELGVAIRTDEPEEGDAWKQYAGTYTGSNADYRYTVVISNDGITLKVDSGDTFEATNITLSYDSDWEKYDLKFTVNGVNYTMEFYDTGAIYLEREKSQSAQMHKN